MAVDATWPGPREGELPEDVLSDLFACSRRRLLLARLADCESARLADLAASVAATEVDCRESAVDPDRYRSVRNEIFEDHLPKLLATGVVEYDSMTGTLSLSAPWIASRLEDDDP